MHLNYTWKIEHDLEEISQAAKDNFFKLNNAVIFLTGGTGFIGCWLLESLRYSNEKFNLNIQVTILTRDINAFKKKSPHLANYEKFRLFEGEILDSKFPDQSFTHLIHAATDASAYLNEKNPTLMFDTIVEGTRNVLKYSYLKNIKKILFLSSGAVYGRQPLEMMKIKEDWNGDVDFLDPRLTYAEGKRAAEMLCAIYAKQYNLNISIARIFALLGPYLSLDIHFAAGNFIRDCIEGKKIIVHGSGLPSRSYMYASDLTIWLWHLLVCGKGCKSYNVGSDESISIKDLAKKTSDLLGNHGYKVMKTEDSGWNLGRYVPDTSRALADHGLKKTVSIEDAILRTALWNNWKG
jgi:nucleoside-diphosphate-sugar epimerase